MTPRILAVVVLAHLLAATGVRAAPALPPTACQFIADHCSDCHDADSHKDGLDLTSLPFDLDSPKTFDLWVKVHDRVRDGEMPPRKEPRPDATSLNAFLKSIGDPMVKADQAREAAEGGRAVWRRLNRYEYENAMRDLFHAPWLQIKEMLPEDGESHRFNKDGLALSVSHVQIESYLEAAQYALHEMMPTSVSKPASTVHRYYARQQGSFIGKMKYSSMNSDPERSTFPLLGWTAQPDVLSGKAPVSVGASDPVKREQEAFGVVASTYEPIEIRFNAFHAPVSGHYKLRFSGYTFWAGPLNEKRWWMPNREDISRGRRDEPIMIYSETEPRLLRWLGTFDVHPEPSVHELDVYLLAGETIQPDAARLFRSRPPAWHNPLAQKDGQPGVAYQWMEVEGPIYDQWPTPAQKLMFADLPTKEPAHGEAVQVVSSSPRSDAARLLHNFMSRAYRRPAPDSETARFLAVFDAAQKSGDNFADAICVAYSAILCSPDFVCVEEKPGRLDDYALASRLSFFLWNSPPDDQLRSLAAAGTLHDPAVLRQQVNRLLDDPRSQRFVDAFLDYWLDLRKIVATAPDSTLYPDYYLDDLLTESAEQETQLFFGDLIRRDLPSSNIVSSAFTFLNERLANHYGIPGVSGVAMRRVELPPDSPRGGLMTQASVLKVTANGTTTSPVVRGVWIMERILGKPPPQKPASVPAIEPDIRGATTIRAQLEKHRSLASCAACHAKIDPAGFALENFDVMGGWRDTYRALGSGTPVPGIGHNGQKFTFVSGPTVDASSQLPDGRSFHDVRELKKLLLADPRQIARNFVEQLICYGTGAAVRFGDRPQVEAILDRAEPSHYGVRSLIQEIVQSELFQTK